MKHPICYSEIVDKPDSLLPDIHKIFIKNYIELVLEVDFNSVYCTMDRDISRIYTGICVGDKLIYVDDNGNFINIRFIMVSDARKAVFINIDTKKAMTVNTVDEFNKIYQPKYYKFNHDGISVFKDNMPVKDIKAIHYRNILQNGKIITNENDIIHYYDMIPSDDDGRRELEEVKPMYLLHNAHVYDFRNIILFFGPMIIITLILWIMKG